MAPRSAFTLLEVVLVMVIIGVLATVAALNLVATADKSRVNATEVSLQTIDQALKQYYFTHGAYPTTADGLDALVAGKYLEKRPLDAWKREFLYYSPGSSGREYDLYSAGKDAIADTDDDVRAWEIK